ncbi:acyl-CoA dehydrogenase family protein [Dactylosporangium sp. CS-047395]|uniref:acyl-CoA dehydrogenase family protein n=1 Tax=Dactylosporangium sp. CS-047395 TaxID=3239936 RepID=UPI003D9407B6
MTDDLADLVRRICTDHEHDPDRVLAALTSAGLTHVGFAGEGDLRDALTIAAVLAAHAVPTHVPEQAVLAGRLAERAGVRLPDGPVAAVLDPAAVPWARAATHLILADGTLLPAGAYRVTPRTNLAGEPRDEVDVAAAPVPDELELRGALLRSVQIAAALRTVLDLTLRYARERVQFGRPIGKLDAVRQQVALLAGEVEATAAGVEAATAALAGSGDALIPVAAAKVQAGIAATAGARIAHQVHGAIGVTREHPLHRYTTRLWSWRDEFGGEEYWAARLAAAVGPDPWPVLAAQERMGS